MVHFFSRSLYRCLLRLHPPSFQREFADEMLWIFDAIAAKQSTLPLFGDGLVSLGRQWGLAMPEAAGLGVEEAAGRAPPKVRAPARYASGGDDVLRLRALLALRDVEGHLLAFPKLAVALGGDVREVGEDVGAAAVLLDEAEALFRVEPLHGASSHVISPSGQCPGVRTVPTPLLPR